MMTITVPEHPAVSRRAERVWARLAACVTVVAIAAGVAVSCSSPDAIDRLTIVNPTEFDVEVRVSDTSKTSWQILGPAASGSSTVNEFVTDEGPRWVFQFHYAGKLIAERTVDRETLVRDEWRVEVPASVSRTMRRLGFERPPER